MKILILVLLSLHIVFPSYAESVLPLNIDSNTMQVGDEVLILSAKNGEIKKIECNDFEILPRTFAEITYRKIKVGEVEREFYDVYADTERCSFHFLDNRAKLCEIGVGLFVDSGIDACRKIKIILN